MGANGETMDDGYLSTNELAAKMGKTIWTVFNRAKKHGIPKEKRYGVIVWSPAAQALIEAQPTLGRPKKKPAADLHPVAGC